MQPTLGIRPREASPQPRRPRRQRRPRPPGEADARGSRAAPDDEVDPRVERQDATGPPALRDDAALRSPTRTLVAHRPRAAVAADDRDPRRGQRLTDHL